MDTESAGGLFLTKAEVQTPLQDVVSDVVLVQSGRVAWSRGPGHQRPPVEGQRNPVDALPFCRDEGIDRSEARGR
jgi:hypothetical protein